MTNTKKQPKNQIGVVFVCPNASNYFFKTSGHQSVGGSELQCSIYAMTLAEDSEFKVTVLVDNTTGSPRYPNTPITFKTLGTPAAKSATKKIYSVVRDLLKYIPSPPNDIVIHRGLSFHTPFVHIISRIFRKKIIYMVAHDGDVMKHLHPYYKKPAWRLIWPLMQRSVVQADCIVAQSAWQQHVLRTSHDRIATNRSSAHHMPNNCTKQKRRGVLWIARGVAWKQPHHAIDLAEKMQDVPFTIIMPPTKSEERLWSDIQNRAKRTKNVTLKSYVDPFRIESYFASTKIFLNTSIREGFPNTFIQAAKYGTPITSLHVNPSNIFGSDGVGICASGNMQKLESDIHRLLSNQHLWKRYSESAREYAESTHDIQRIIVNDKQLLRNLAQDHDS